MRTLRVAVWISPKAKSLDTLYVNSSLFEAPDWERLHNEDFVRIRGNFSRRFFGFGKQNELLVRLTKHPEPERLPAIDMAHCSKEWAIRSGLEAALPVDGETVVEVVFLRRSEQLARRFRYRYRVWMLIIFAVASLTVATTVTINTRRNLQDILSNPKPLALVSGLLAAVFWCFKQLRDWGKKDDK